MQASTSLTTSNNKNKFQHYTQLGMLFLCCYLTANIIGPKPVQVGWFIIPAGLIIFPLTYLLGAVITEIYGFAASRRIIWTSLVCNLLLAVACQMAIFAPFAVDWPNQQAYVVVLGNSSRLMFISVVTYFIGELTNAYVVSKLKVKMAGKNFWLRGLCGNWLGEGIETALFIPLAFYYLPVEHLINMWLFYICFKVTYAFCVIPVMQMLVKMLKQHEFAIA